MKTLDEIVSALDNELEAELATKLRAQLGAMDKSWLVDALVELALQDRHLSGKPGRELSRQAHHVEPPAERRRRLDRIRRLGLDEAKLRELIERYRGLDRDSLVANRYLIDPPHKGKQALDSSHRSEVGEGLLRQAHDLFYALLFGDPSQGIDVSRTRRDFLTITLPAAKSDTLERFMLAVTETRVTGTWLDPEGVSDDIDAVNKILQVEYGDTADGLVSDGLIVVLGVINNLEVNEQILYARIEQLERSTLVK